VTWFYGAHDAWINPDRIRDIMSIQSGATREVIELPSGHMPTNSDQALEAYQLITHRIWQHLFIEDIEVRPPSQSSAIELRNDEWSRTPKSTLKDQADYWEKYLLGEGQLEVGFDVMAETQEYRDFMRNQVQLLDICAGEAVADLGSGTGMFALALLGEEKYRSLFQNGKAKAPRVVTVDFVASALEKSRKRIPVWLNQYGIDAGAFEFQLANLEVSRLKPVWRFLRGEYFSTVKLKGKIEGLPDYLPGLWAKNYSEALHEILRGKPVETPDLERLRRAFSESETNVLLEINRAARLLKNQLVRQDFKDPEIYDQLVRDGRLNHSEFNAGHLEFGSLNFRNSTSDMSLPFEDQQFDKILCSIVLSYLFNPEESLLEFYRMLKPGGRLVISTFRPDMDMSVTYANLIHRIESEADFAPPEGMSRDVFLNATRAFANSAAFLLHLEEEGHFRFFSRSELEGLLRSAGFRSVEFHEAFGCPPQAYVATCSR
jgi:ubiquinone/menaquinone biosynthesis C-methylase UbiE